MSPQKHRTTSRVGTGLLEAIVGVLLACAILGVVVACHGLDGAPTHGVQR